MIPRIIFDIFFGGSAMIMPFWFTLIFALVGLLYFARWWEAIGVAFFVDLLFGGGINFWFGILFPTTLLAIVIFWLTESLRTAMRDH